MYQNHLVRSIKWSSDQLHFDSCACSLHAFCMHTCQDWVSQKWIDFDECFAHTSSECFAIINWHICMHIFIMKSRMCANCQDCVLCMQSQSPSDMWTTRPPTLCRVFLWKGGGMGTEFGPQISRLNLIGKFPNLVLNHTSPMAKFFLWSKAEIPTGSENKATENAAKMSHSGQGLFSCRMCHTKGSENSWCVFIFTPFSPFLLS